MLSASAPPRYTFRKSDRLCARRLIKPLFQRGAAFNTYPLRFVWLLHAPAETAAGTRVSLVPKPVSRPALPPRHGGKPAPALQVLLSVSKRHFKRAHDRTRIKRLLREAWRLHGLPHLQPLAVPAGLSVAVLYIGKEKPDSLALLVKKLIKGLDRLTAELPANAAASAP